MTVLISPHTLKSKRALGDCLGTAIKTNYKGCNAKTVLYCSGCNRCFNCSSSECCSCAKCQDCCTCGHTCSQCGFYKIYPGTLDEQKGVSLREPYLKAGFEYALLKAKVPITSKVMGVVGSSPISGGSMSLIDTVKAEGKEAGYRILAVEITKTIRVAITGILKKRTSRQAVKGVSEFLNGEYGFSLLSLGVGMGLGHLPWLAKNKIAQEVARELRVGGAARAGSLFMEDVKRELWPALHMAVGLLNEAISNPEDKIKIPEFGVSGIKVEVKEATKEPITT